MRKRLGWILLILALGTAWYRWQTHKTQLLGVAHILHARLFPCSSPITYSLGAIDAGYALPREDLAAALREAETAWEGPARRNLFELTAASGAVTINLIYDDRQAALDKLKTLGIVTEQSLASYKDLKARYDELTVKVDAEETRLKEIMGRYKQREAAYNAAVRRLNARGTATAAEVRKVNSARAALATQFGGIKQIESALNADVATLNALGTTMNQLIVQFKIDAAQYNRAGSGIGRYEEGLYKVADGLQTIAIYKYTDRAQLVNLLAHEMGHALGLDHVTDPDSLMYPINQGRGLKLTPQDMAQLERVCKLD